MSKANDGFDQPHEISKAQQVFPAGVVGKLMPDMSAIPEDHTEKREWLGFFSDLFLKGSDVAFQNWELHTRDGVDGNAAWTHLVTIVGSYEPKHEHKEAAFAWLASRWFGGIESKEAN